MILFLLFIEFCKVIVWPALVFWIIFYFRKDIVGFIDRVNHLKFPGGELTAIQLQEEQGTLQNFETAKELLSQNGQILQLASSMVKQLKSEYEEQKTNNTTTVEILLNEIAFRDIIIEFERIYISIFGSQITLLERLSVVTSDGMSEQEIAIFWDNVKKVNYVYKDWRLHDYLNFLLQQRLISSQNLSYRITTKGKAFLFHLVTMNYPKNKLL
jgi:hypothetical protein